jgi:tungstate transport system substrate-binding protein
MVMLTVWVTGCATDSNSGKTTKTTTTEDTAKKAETSMILATTTSTADTGLLDYLLPKFEKKYNVKVKTIAVGTGEAIAMGERGEADVLLVHSRTAENKFMTDGNGSLRLDVMYNDFVIIGPKDDPAKIKGKQPGEALTLIKNSASPFITRGDESGTHKKEKTLWTNAGITPSGDWYINVGQGMGEATRIANEKQAYILIDRGTYLSLKDSIKLDVLVEGQKELFNPYGVIVVSKTKFDKVNEVDATAFAKWITSAEVQKLIGDFGKKEFGQSLFIPSAI